LTEGFKRYNHNKNIQNDVMLK
jgi:hypothetical protein